MPPIHVRALSDGEFNAKYEELAAECGDHKVLSAGERKHLPNVMMDDELLIWMSSGTLASTGKEARKGGNCLIALTDRRILILDKRLFGGTQTIAIDLDKVNSITGDTGWIFGSFKIQDGGDERKVDMVAKKTVHTFVQQVQRAIEARKLEARTPLADEWEESGGYSFGADGRSGGGDSDLVTQLERLADLRDRGVLTDLEFQKQKDRILSR